MHTDGFIFPAASIYLAMKEVDPDMAYDVMKNARLLQVWHFLYENRDFGLI